MPDRLLRSRWFVRWMIPLAGLLIVAAFAMAAVAYSQQRHRDADVNRRLCHVAYTDRQIMRHILELAEARALSRPGLSPYGKKTVRAYYASQYALIPPIDCGEIAAK